MVSERLQRRIDTLPERADAAAHEENRDRATPCQPRDFARCRCTAVERKTSVHLPHEHLSFQDFPVRRRPGRSVPSESRREVLTYHPPPLRPPKRVVIHHTAIVEKDGLDPAQSV